jgi:hypothetical protein
MFGKYPLFQSHIDLAHDLWKKILKKKELVIDATCGNGHDTLVLAKLVFNASEGILYAIDKQAKAITSCQTLLSKELPAEIFNKIHFVRSCHSRFPSEIAMGSASLIVYNLGYLPGGDKNQTTEAPTTLLSVQEALSLLKEGGTISITCYPGHKAGRVEEEKLLEFVKILDPRLFSCCYHRWINRNLSPTLLIIQKACENEINENLT